MLGMHSFRSSAQCAIISLKRWLTETTARHRLHLTLKIRLGTLLLSSGWFVLLLLSGLANPVQSQCSITIGPPLGSTGSTTLVGQSFTTTCAGDVSQVTITSAQAAACSYTATIKTSCDGTGLGSGTTTGNGVAGVNTIVFSTPIHLDAQTTYAVEFTAAGQLSYELTNSDVYSGGSHYLKLGSTCYFSWYGNVDLICSIKYDDNDNDGYSISQGDCNDNDPTRWQSASLYIDADGDGYDNGSATVCYGATIPSGYAASSSGNDCDDNNGATHATETWYLDADGDGYYESSQSSCGSPGAGYNQTASQSGDCDDADNTKWQF